jgi:hypothetical protein
LMLRFSGGLEIPIRPRSGIPNPPIRRMTDFRTRSPSQPTEWHASCQSQDDQRTPEGWIQSQAIKWLMNS